MDLQSAMILLSGNAWTFTYIALVYRGFKDRSYGMPLVALALNFAWEFTFSLIYPPHGTAVAQLINIIWVICDVAIVTTYFLFGYKYFVQRYRNIHILNVLLATNWTAPVPLYAYIIENPEGGEEEMIAILARIAGAIAALVIGSLAYRKERQRRTAKALTIMAPTIAPWAKPCTTRPHGLRMRTGRPPLRPPRALPW